MIVRTRIRQSSWRHLLPCQQEPVTQVASVRRSCICSPTRQTRSNSTLKLVGASHIRWTSTTSKEDNEAIQDAPFPIFNRIADFRQWRRQVAAKERTVGFVPTMGALHDGHLSLVRESLKENDETVVSIFVNPAQFAPSEDLSSYPRTLTSDIKALNSLQSSEKRTISAIFAPTVTEMYPSPDGQPFTQHVEDQVGAFVQVQGLQEQMEGSSRPTFFRGVATVCTKLFHIVEPNLAYFGQKDIQQSIILRRLVSDLLFSYPPSARAIRVMKTTRDERDGLALSSRNAYLTNECRKHASILYKTLSSAKQVWEEEKGKNLGDDITKELVQSILLAANKTAKEAIEAAMKDDVSIEILYISLNDPITLQDLSLTLEASAKSSRGAILSAAALIKQGQTGKVTRLIDNFLLGFSM